jgi:peptide/nickel transport system permease protein
MRETAPVTRPRPGAVARLRRSGAALGAALVLAVMYACAAAAPFLAPYREDSMDRARFFHPPDPVHWIDASGHFHARPFVYGTRLADATEWRYVPDPAEPHPIQLLVRGERYPVGFGLTSDRHLFGSGAGRVNLLGTDAFGRDELSRLLYGARISLSVGLVGIAISFALSLAIGGIAGYAGGWVDALLMRLCELLLSIPALYLLVALRGVFPATLPSGSAYLAVVAILALIGWAGLARVVRGMVRSLRRSDFVAAAEALGAGPARLLVRHILPNTMSFVIVAATVAVPGYILGEVFLSFLGVGVQEPAASWGNMLGQARSLRVLTSFPWLLVAPAAAIFVTVMSFNLFGDGLRDALDPRGAVEGESR